MYSIAVEPKHQLMCIRVSGFWSADVMQRYVADLQTKAASLVPYGGCTRILVNMSDYPIQAQPIAAGHAKIIRHGKREMQARVAIVMKSALSRLQAMRVANLTLDELFDDEASARNWLLRLPTMIDRPTAHSPAHVPNKRNSALASTDIAAHNMNAF